MRKAFIIIISLICAVTARPQQADGRVGTLLGSNDWFTLDREYPMLRDSVKTEFLRLMADALLSVYFNRPDEAVAAIDSLIKNHQHEIGFDNTHSMVILKAAVEDRRGNSPAAAEIMRSFVSQVKASGAQTDLSTAEALCQWFGKKALIGKPSLTRPQTDVTIKARIMPVRLNVENDTAYRGNALYLPVRIGGKERMMMLDTGAPTTFCSKSFAREIGVRTVSDSLEITGTGTGRGSLGVIDSIGIGRMVFRNVPVTVAGDDMTTDSILKLGGLIGMDFINLCGEIQIIPADTTIVIPAEPSPLPGTGRNVYLNESNRLMLNAGTRGGRHTFMFDTGNALATLSSAWYGKNRQWADSVAVSETRLSGGYGSHGKKEYLRLPGLTFSVGGTDVPVSHVFVLPDEQSVTCPADGNIGLILIEGCRKATLNTREMFLKIER